MRRILSMICNFKWLIICSESGSLTNLLNSNLGLLYYGGMVTWWMNDYI